VKLVKKKQKILVGTEEVQDDRLEALSEAEGENPKNIIQQDMKNLKKPERL
jgi:hypothetical protein